MLDPSGAVFPSCNVSVSTNPTDTTASSAAIKGDPVHLVNE